MSYGTGVVLLVVGAILLTGAVALPAAVTDVVKTDVMGLILAACGVLAIVLGFVSGKGSSGR